MYSVRLGGHPPRERTRHEDLAVRREDATEVGVVLTRRHEAVRAQCRDPCTDPHQPTVLTNPLPDHSRPAGLRERGSPRVPLERSLGAAKC
jgi:hypothetical protein